MGDLQTIREILGWCAVINIGILLIAALILLVAKRPIMSIHARVWDLSEEELPRIYFQFLAQYKILIWIFNITPYFALTLVD
jgi:hypothetical protein